MFRTLMVSLVVASALLAGSPLDAQPANDACANATPVVDGAYDFDTTTASTDGDQPCSTEDTLDVWYLYSASCTGFLLAGTCANTDPAMDTVLTVWETGQACLPTVSLGCADDNCGPGAGFASEVSAAVTAGSSYLITVSGWGGQGFEGSLTLSCAPVGSANDDCSAAAPVGNGSFFFDTTAALTDGPSPCGDLGADVWYLYTATCDGDFTATTCGFASFDTVLAVYPAAVGCPPPPGTELACNDNSFGCGTLSEVTVPVAAGEQLIVQVGGASGATGNGILDLSCLPALPPLPNDDCADATPVAEGTFDFDTTGATTDSDQPCSLSDTLDIWFLYTASCDGVATLSACDSPDPNTDTVITIWNTTSCTPSGPGQELACDDDSCTAGSGFASVVNTAVTAGTSYLVTLSGWSGVPAVGSLSITCGAGPTPPQNDDCADATIVGDGIYEFDTSFATTDTDQPCSAQDTRDVWFLYTAPISGELTATTCPTSNVLQDSVLTIWNTDTCTPSGAAALGCNDDACGPMGGFLSAVDVMVTAGESYLISVSGWGGTGAPGSLLLETSPPAFPEPCTPPPGTLLSHSNDAVSIVPFATLACSVGMVNGDGAYYRTFDLGAFGVAGAIDVVAVEVGVAESEPGAGFVTQPLTVRLLSDSDDDPAPLSRTVSLGADEFGLPDYFDTGVECLPLDTPVTVPAATTNLIVEVGVADASLAGTGHVFLIGANENGQTDETYYRSDACGTPEPTDVATLGFPNMHVVIGVYYVDSQGGVQFIRGDSDGSGDFNGLVDSLYTLAFQFSGGPAPVCLEAADADGVGGLNGLVDALYSLAHQFQGGPPPPPPYPSCGADPDPTGSLGCSANGCP